MDNDKGKPKPKLTGKDVPPALGTKPIDSEDLKVAADLRKEVARLDREGVERSELRDRFARLANKLDGKDQGATLGNATKKPSALGKNESKPVEAQLAGEGSTESDRDPDCKSRELSAEEAERCREERRRREQEGGEEQE